LLHLRFPLANQTRRFTRKQCGLDPSELDASVAGRIPVRFGQDDRYFTDSFQAMLADGYTSMFERMLDSPNITVRTEVNYAEVAKAYPGIKTIFTGPVDEYVDFRFGPSLIARLNSNTRLTTANASRMQQSSTIPTITLTNA
jgi:UDP-galactopyranose mutase